MRLKKLLSLCTFLSIWCIAFSQTMADFPWLDNVLDEQNCCANQKVTAFPFSNYSFVYVEATEDCGSIRSKLYFDDGQCWCTSSADRDCLAAYGLSAADGVPIYTCEGSTAYDIFKEYPWLNDVVDQDDCCKNGQVELIDLGAYSFLYVAGNASCSNNLGKLYYQTGQLYCSDADNFNCLMAYGFLAMERPIFWTCDGVINIPTETETETDVVRDVDASLFLTNSDFTVTLVDCTLSDGSTAKCYQIVTNGVPTDHNMGPWCPDNIADGADAGGIWLENGEVYDVDGAFIANMATFYDDDKWLMYDDNGDIYKIKTEDDCANAANPNVGAEYENFCVECLPSYVADLQQTYLIPVTPVKLAEPITFGGMGAGGDMDAGGTGGDGPPTGGPGGDGPPAGGPGGGGPPADGGAGADGGGAAAGPSVRGIAFNGVRYDAAAPTSAILGAYTLAPFDDAGGHINLTAGYHYHAATGVSTEITQSDGHAGQIGYALDGHAIYARLDANGAEPTDLDDCRGHYDAIRGYHYHVDAAGNNNFINCLSGAYVVSEADGDTDGGTNGGTTTGGTNGGTGGGTTTGGTNGGTDGGTTTGGTNGGTDGGTTTGDTDGGTDGGLDCTGTVDDCGICDGSGPSTWYEDNDGDFLGNPAVSQEACDQPTGYVANADDTDDTESTTNTESGLHAAFADFADDMTIYIDGDEIVIETDGLPDHTSPYWSNTTERSDTDPMGNLIVTETAEVNHPLFVEPTTTTFDRMAPGNIDDFSGSYTLRVPINPSKASSSSATGLGAIGFAVSGSMIYNDEEGPNVPLDNAAPSLDYTGAHTGPQSYHYHLETKAWSNDDAKTIGIISDGFFLYGRKCTSTGTYPTDLDESGGHTSTTQHSTEGEYHYHIQNDLYLNLYYILFPGDYQGTPNSID